MRVQSLSRLREEIVAEGQLHSESVCVPVRPAPHRQDSVTTACQTDLSGEVSYTQGLF